MSGPKARADYGLDAPGLVRGFFIGGTLVGALGLALAMLAPENGLAGAAISMGASFVLTALLMVLSSRLGKMRARDRLLDELALRKDASVLDIGCGRGLLLIGAAKRVPAGRAVGVDLWSGTDLSDNRRDATLANAAIEGVTVEVVDADMRQLPFEDASFDAVVAMFSIHNVGDPDGRARAVREVARVLAPGGRVAIQDFARTGEYLATLREAGLEASRGFFSPWTFPPSRVVRAIKAVRPK